jgi:hypothetical protein
VAFLVTRLSTLDPRPFFHINASGENDEVAGIIALSFSFDDNSGQFFDFQKLTGVDVD